MRTSTGLRVFFGISTAAVLTSAFIACGGSDDNQDVISADAGSETSLPDTSVPDTSGPEDTGAHDTGGGDAGPQYDAGLPATIDGGPLYEGGVKCVAGGQVEEEPNDNEQTANELRYGGADGGICTAPGCSRCGVIGELLPDVDAAVGLDAGAIDPEYVKFVLAQTAKSYFIQYQGDVKLTVYINDPDGGADGGVYEVPGATSLPFVRDAQYYVKVESANGGKTDWRVTLFESP